jgi:hypothetical protein
MTGALGGEQDGGWIRAARLITQALVNGCVNSSVHNPSPPRSRHAGKRQKSNDFQEKW